MRYPLVDGQGNFGSIDGDAPAAMRYTEARLTALSMEMLADLERTRSTSARTTTRRAKSRRCFRRSCRTCSSTAAPASPSAWRPRCRRTTSREICDAIIAVIDKPEMPDDDLVKIVKGPDFPTGGIIYGLQGIADAYRTGRGIMKIRAKVQVEEGQRAAA